MTSDCCVTKLTVLYVQWHKTVSHGEYPSLLSYGAEFNSHISQQKLFWNFVKVVFNEIMVKYLKYWINYIILDIILTWN